MPASETPRHTHAARATLIVVFEVSVTVGGALMIITGVEFSPASVQDPWDRHSSTS
jgi:hypothetical protein